MHATLLIAFFFLLVSCSSPTEKPPVDEEAIGDDTATEQTPVDGDIAVTDTPLSDGDAAVDELLADDAPLIGEDGIIVVDGDELSAEEDAVLSDDDAVAIKECVEDNSADAIAARDGFIEVCAVPLKYPLAVCGDGSPYKFTYRPAAGTAQGLLLYFRGGGGCNDYISCWGKDGVGGEGRRVSTMENDVNTAPMVLPQLHSTLGIFYLNESLNPLRDYDQVHIAYCTGDAGLRSEMVTLTRPEEADADAPGSIATYFHGQYNLLFALDKAQELFPAPSAIVMFGSSAGSYASLSAVPMVDERWSDPQIPIAYYSEGGVGVGMSGIDQTVLDTVAAYNGASGSRLIRFAQFSFISDLTQKSYAPPAYQDPAAFQNEMKTLFEARAAANPGNYRYFALNGTCHTVAQSPALFQQFTNASGSWKPVSPAVKPNPDLTQNGVNVVDWMGVVFGLNPFDQSLENVAGDLTTVATTCPVPGGN